MPVLRDADLVPGRLLWGLVTWSDEIGAVIRKRDADGCALEGELIPTASFQREGHYFVEVTPR